MIFYTHTSVLQLTARRYFYANHVLLAPPKHNPSKLRGVKQ
nr:MAG TPA: hypothetical protein [Caudoviricetes sp.]